MEKTSHGIFNISDWVGRLKVFSEELGKSPLGIVSNVFECSEPVSNEMVQQVESNLGVKMPTILTRLITECGGTVRQEYRWEVGDRKKQYPRCLKCDDVLWGRVEFALDKLADLKNRCNDITESSWIRGNEVESEFWRNSLPLMQMRNGDFLAVDIEGGPDDPEVRYLSHDSAGQVLAPTLSGFLSTWERLYCIGPEIWILEPFIDVETGHITSENTAAKQLHKLFESIIVPH